MKKLIKITVLLVWSHTVAAQGVHVGAFASVPLGEFKANKLNASDGSGGFAKTGWGMALEMNARSDSWPEGLMFHARSTFQFHEMDVREVGRKFNDQINNTDDLALKQFIEPEGASVTVDDADFRIQTLALGGAYQRAFLDRFTATAKLGFGLMFMKFTSPLAVAHRNKDNAFVDATVIKDSFVPASFMVNLGVGAGYLITENLGVNVSVDYAYSSIGAYDDDGETVTGHLRVQYVNPGISVFYRFR